MLDCINGLEIRSADNKFSIPTNNQAVIIHLNEDFDIDSKIGRYLLYTFLFVSDAHGPSCHFWLLPATILECPCSVEHPAPTGDEGANGVPMGLPDSLRFIVKCLIVRDSLLFSFDEQNPKEE